MESIANLAPKAVLFGLEPEVETELADSLRGACCVISRSMGLPVIAGFGSGGGIVFCPRGAAFSAAKAAFPNLPVVIVSRLPDTLEWLDALELGAADYVAGPFESVQMRWLFETHCRRARTVAAVPDPVDMQMPKCA
jgi:DNA-binding NarL/FixJ family response regulator